MACEALRWRYSTNGIGVEGSDRDNLKHVYRLCKYSLTGT